MRSPARPGPGRSIRWLAVALALLAAGYLGNGIRELTTGADAAHDLWIRWAGQRYVALRRNPYDVQARIWAEQRGVPPPPSARDTRAIDGVGAAGVVGDPPWAFLSGMILFAPAWPAARWYFALLNLIALCVIGRYAWQAGRAFGRPAACLLAASTLALGSHSTALGVGQVGPIAVALLCLSAAALQQNQGWRAGFIGAIAALKPSIAGPFLLAVVVKAGGRSLCAITGYLVGASCVVWWLTSTDPGEMLQQMLWGADLLAEVGYGLHRVVPAERGPGGTFGLAALVSGLVVAWMLWRRDTPVAIHFAVAAVAARLWTYHRAYDNLMLLFLLVPLGVIALEREQWRWWTVFLAVGSTLWLPTRACALVPIQVAQHAVWIGGLAALLMARATQRWVVPREVDTEMSTVSPNCRRPADALLHVVAEQRAVVGQDAFGERSRRDAVS